MFKYTLSFIFLTLLIFCCQEAMAGMGGSGMGMGPPSPPCGTPPFPPCAVPLDGGIGILAGAGALYGYFKLSNRNKKNPA